MVFDHGNLPPIHFHMLGLALGPGLRIDEWTMPVSVMRVADYVDYYCTE